MEIFRLLYEAKFPIGPRMKDAFDKIIKEAKKSAPVSMNSVSGTSLSNPAFAGKDIAAIVVDEVFRQFGFQKTGSTPEEQLASDTVEFTDGTTLNYSTTLIFFK